MWHGLCRGKWWQMLALGSNKQWFLLSKRTALYIYIYNYIYTWSIKWYINLGIEIFKYQIPKNARIPKKRSRGYDHLKFMYIWCSRSPNHRPRSHTSTQTTSSGSTFHWAAGSLRAWIPAVGCLTKLPKVYTLSQLKVQGDGIGNGFIFASELEF